MWPKNRLIEHAVSLDAKSTPLIEEPIGTDMLASPSGVSFPIFRWRYRVLGANLTLSTHTELSRNLPR
jgi:hypothetical protein